MVTTNTAKAGTEGNSPIQMLVFGSLIGIVLCWIFFVVAFFITNYNSRHEVPHFNVNITGTTNVTQEAVSDIVHEVMYSKDYQQKLKKLMSDRERIVKREHDSFRAELGTWLSIFGLLSILGTIMASVLTVSCQHLSLKNEKDEIYAALNKLSAEQAKEKKQLEEAKTQVEEAKTQVAEIGKQVTEIKSQVKEAKRLNATISRNASQSMAASEALALDAQSDCSASDAIDIDLANIERECKKFINMWWWENDGDFEQEIDKKVAMGISVLKKFNDLLSKKINNNEDITAVLKKLNLINIYLGQKEKIDPFYSRFLDAIKREKPLIIKIEDVEKALNQNDIGQMKMFSGYYKNIIDR